MSVIVLKSFARPRRRVLGGVLAYKLGLERSILPAIAEQELHLAARAAVLHCGLRRREAAHQLHGRTAFFDRSGRGGSFDHPVCAS